MQQSVLVIAGLAAFLHNINMEQEFVVAGYGSKRGYW